MGFPNKNEVAQAESLELESERNDVLATRRIHEVESQILTSGPLSQNPSELLGSHRMRQTLEILKGHADLVLFDTPPSLPARDAAGLSGQDGGVILVADAHKTRREVVGRAVEGLRQVGVTLIGSALNRVPPRGDGSHYYYLFFCDSGEDNSRPTRRRMLSPTRLCRAIRRLRTQGETSPASSPSSRLP